MVCLCILDQLNLLDDKMNAHLICLCVLDRQCGHHMGDNFGVLESPNFPGNYPVNVECIWKINPENSRRILIILPMIELANEEDCGDMIVMRKSREYNICLRVSSF